MTHPASENRDIVRKLYKLHFLLGKVAHTVLKEEMDIGFSRFLIMVALKRHRELSQRKLAQFLGITDAAVSRKLDDLTGQTLLTRRENPENRREHILALTEAGTKQLEAAVKLLDTKLDEIFGILSSREREGLCSAVEKLLSRVCKDESLVPQSANSPQ